MVDEPGRRILDQLRATRFAGLEGALVTASIPVSAPLLNAWIQSLMPPSAHIRDLWVQPAEDNRLIVRVKLARPGFLPPISITVSIDRQPQLPESPVLVARILSFPGLVSLAAGFIPAAASLGRGIRLEDERIYVDFKALLERQGLADLLVLIERVQVTTADGVLRLDLALRVPAAS